MSLLLEMVQGLAIWLGALFIAACFLVFLEWVIDMYHKRKKVK